MIYLLIIGLVMLIAGAEIFVNSSVNIAKKLRIPTVVIALTIIAIGTSAPETVISFTASAKQESELSMSNIIGSNFFNLMFILGLCALIRPITVKMKEMGPESWLLTGATTALFITMMITYLWFDHSMAPRTVGVVMVVSFIVYLSLLVRHALQGNRTHEQITNRTSIETPHHETPLWLAIIGVVAGLGIILYGGILTVENARDIALAYDVPQRIIGLTIIGAGTSLPELAIALLACKRRESGIALGTIIGTNIYNLLFILGGAGIIAPLRCDPQQMHDLAILAFGHLMFMIFVFFGKKITRIEGIIMVTVYLAYLGYCIIFTT